MASPATAVPIVASALKNGEKKNGNGTAAPATAAEDLTESERGLQAVYKLLKEQVRTIRLHCCLEHGAIRVKRRTDSELSLTAAVVCSVQAEALRAAKQQQLLAKGGGPAGLKREVRTKSCCW